MLPGAMMMELGYAPGERNTPLAETRAASKETPEWFIRAAIGFGSVPKSGQRDLLEINGYENHGVRWHLRADGAAFLWPHVGLGGFAGYAWRNVEPAGGGPKLEEEIFRLGAQVPLTTGSEGFRFIFAPRLGLVHGRQSLHQDGDFVFGPLFGASAGLVFPKVHIGFELGGYYAPVPASGALGERDDFGGLDLSFSVYFDG